MKREIIKAANESMYGMYGNFVDRDSKWISAETPEKFKSYLESIGFEVTNCYATNESKAIAETADGYIIAYNGFCTIV